MLTFTLAHVRFHRLVFHFPFLPSNICYREFNSINQDERWILWFSSFLEEALQLLVKEAKPQKSTTQENLFIPIEIEGS